jgi:hypothetical protein
MTRSRVCLVLGLSLLLVLPATAAANRGDFTVGGGWSTNATGGAVHIAFAAHAGAPGFSGLLPSDESLLGFQDFTHAAASVTEATQLGEDPTGHEVAKGDLDGPLGPLEPFMFEGPVTCLTVVGNHASFFYEFKHAEPQHFEGGGIQVYVEDNGPPANGQSVDGFSFDPPIPGPGPGLPPIEGPTVCPPPPLAGYLQMASGNLIVRDAP